MRFEQGRGRADWSQGGLSGCLECLSGSQVGPQKWEDGEEVASGRAGKGPL